MKKPAMLNDLEQARAAELETLRSSFLGKLSSDSRAIGDEIVRLETVSITGAQLDQVELLGALTDRDDIGDAPGGWLAACALLLRWERGRVSMYHTVYEHLLSILGRADLERAMIPDDTGSPARIASFKAAYHAARYVRAALEHHTSKDADAQAVARHALDMVSGLTSEDAPQVISAAIIRLDKADAPLEQAYQKAARMVSLKGRYTVPVRELFEQALERVRLVRKLSPEQTLERVAQLLMDSNDKTLNALFDALEQTDPERGE